MDEELASNCQDVNRNSQRADSDTLTEAISLRAYSVAVTVAQRGTVGHTVIATRQTVKLERLQ